MLLRKDGNDAVIAIPQPSHSWLSGQLAHAWGNGRFAPPSPREEVCLAAEQHDIGWLHWEASPGFDPNTGLPQDFRHVETPVHIALWREGVRRARAYGRYPALLVSLHAHTIYTRYFDIEKASPENAAAVRDFLDEQHAFQGALSASLQADPHATEATAPDGIERNRMLIAALDRLSLELCWGVRADTRVPDVPVCGAERVELTLRPRDGATHEIAVEPWPFGPERVQVRAEGRRLEGTFPDADAMRRALDRAPPVMIMATLCAG